MFLHALSTANPEAVFTQSACADIARSEVIASRVNRRSQLILRTVLAGDSGVDQRRFAVTDIPGVFNYTADQLNAAFRKEAPALARKALNDALAKAGVTAGELDALFIATCTGYLCPGVSSYVAEAMGIASTCYLSDVVGHGCGAAIPMMRAANAFLKAEPDAIVATVAVEICSAAFFLDDDPGVLISACLFGDGAAAAIWKNSPSSNGLKCRDFSTLHRPEHRDDIRFETREGKLRNLLSAQVPSLAAAAVEDLYREEKNRANARNISRIAAHPGGRDVINALSARLPQFDFEPGRRVLRSYGNMSSPSVLFVLDDLLKKDAPDETNDWWLVSFGAGFAAHGCRIGTSASDG